MDILGRYEKHEGLNHTYINFKQIDAITVEYTYGVVGFGVGNTKQISVGQAKNYVVSATLNGYEKVDEVPLSEVNADGSYALLDWIGGVSR